MRGAHYLTSFLVAMFVSCAILPGVIRLSRRLGAVDRPGGRRVHKGEIPRLGGIGIFFGFVSGVGAALLTADRVLSVGQPSEYLWYGAALGACLIFLAGVLDDIFQFRPRVKFELQLLAALLAVGFGVRIGAMSSPLGGVVDLGLLSPIITVGWILLVTNAMNLVDGLDGLAGGIALITATTIASVALAMDRFGVVILAMALAGALLGFLRYNFPPARIFMGDGGSQFLGYVVAVISIRGSQKGATAVAITVPLLVLGLPLLDLAMTVFRRARGNGLAKPIQTLRSIASADRKHLHHNLLDLGLQPRRAALVLYLIASLFALSGYLSLLHKSLPLAALTLVLSLGAVLVIKAVLRRKPQRKPAEEARAGLRGGRASLT